MIRLLLKSSSIHLRVCVANKWTTNTAAAAVVRMNSTQYDFSNTRKSLSPFIKLIHPDFFVNEPLKVQQANLSSLQVINLLSDRIEEMNIQMKRSGTVYISHPWSKSYGVSCYLRLTTEMMATTTTSTTTATTTATVTSTSNVNHNTGRNEEKQEEDEKVVTTCTTQLPLPLIRLQRDLISPLVFCTRQVVPSQAAGVAVAQVASQLDDMMSAAGLSRIWPGLPSSADRKRTASNNPYDDIPGGGGGSEQRGGSGGDTNAFDMDLVTDAMHRRIAELYVTDRNQMKNKAFPETHTRRHVVYHQRKHMEEQVDRYLASGNVLIKHMNTQQEFDVMVRLRQFLMDFGMEMNLSMDSWRKVIVILDIHTVQYSCEIVGGRHVLYFPVNFKHRILLQFITENVPVCFDLPSL